MSRKSRKKTDAAAKDAATAFFRGAIVTGLLGALGGERVRGGGKRLLRLSLQGGVALSAATYASESLYRRNYAAAAAAAALGAAGVVAIDRLPVLNYKKDDSHG